MKDTVPNIIEKKNTRSRWRAIGTIILLVILILVVLGIVTAYAQLPASSDFLKFYSSTRFLLEGQSIYTPVTFDTISDDIQIDPELLSTPIHPNLNPPFQTLLLSPLGLVSYGSAYWIWSLLSIILGLFSVYLLFDAYRFELRHSHVFELSIVFLLFFPTILTIISGQFSILLFFLITLAWTSARSKKARLAGIALGLALSLKIFTGIFIPVLILQRRWSLLKWYLGTFLVFNILAFIAVGSKDHLEYIRTISTVTWYSASWNASIMGFFSRIFGGSVSMPLVNAPNIGIILTLVASIIIVIQLLWIAFKGDTNSKYDFDLVYSITVVSMLLLSPLGWIYYLVILLIPLVVGWYAAKKNNNLILRILLIFVWILCTIPHSISKEDIRPIDMFTWTGFPFYGLLLFFIILLILIWKFRKQQSKTLEKNQSQTNLN